MATCFTTCWFVLIPDTGFPVICAPQESLRIAGQDSRFSIPTMPGKNPSLQRMCPRGRADHILCSEGFYPYDAGKESFATQNVIGRSRGAEQRLEFKTAADTRLLLIRIARPPSGKFDNKIAGTVWIDGVRLTQED